MPEQRKQLFPNTLRLLLIVEALLALSLLLSSLDLFAGLPPHALKYTALLTFDTSAVPGDVQAYLQHINATATDAGTIPDWYDLHLLSICTGQWNDHEAGRGRNATSTACERQTPGYRFRLSQMLAADTVPEARGLFENWQSEAFETSASVGMLIANVALQGLALLIFFLFGVVGISFVGRSVQLNALRVALLCCIANLVSLINGAAQVTLRAQGVVGGKADAPVTFRAWMGVLFYALIWIDMVLGFLIVGLCFLVAFVVGSFLRGEEKKKKEQDLGAARVSGGET